MDDKFRLALGDSVRDIVTGFRGVVTGRAQHLTGCDTYGVSAREHKDAEVKGAQWFDDNRLELLGEPRLVLQPVNAERPLRAAGACGDPEPTRTVR